MKIYTYYENINLNHPKILDIWNYSWARLGFEPVILDEKDAKKSTLYAKYSRVVKKLPTVNPVGFDYHCFMRYLAVSAIAFDNIIISTEPDVINYSLCPEDIISMKIGNIVQYSVVPALHIGINLGFTNFCEQLIEHKLQHEDNYMGRPHLSDQDFIARYNIIQRIYPNNYVAEVFEDGYLTKPVVHFGTPYMSRRNLMPKDHHIEKIRPIRS